MLNQNVNTTSQTGNPIPSVQNQKRLPKKNRLSMYFLIAIVLITAIAGIGISLRQFFIRDTVAPTAPEESQANIDKIQECSLSFDVTPPETGISCVKEAYQDELSNTAGEYELLEMEGVFAPGETVVYNFTVTNNGEIATVITATDSILSDIEDGTTFGYEFLDSNCGDDAYDYDSDVITCVTDSLAPNESQDFTFRIKLNEDISSDITFTNLVAITDGTLNEDCSVSVDIDTENPTEAYCNEECTENSDCVEENNACFDGLCRLVTNPNSETCDEVEPTPSPSVNPTPSPTPTPTPETVAYCGDYCSSNSDCLNESQICYFNECRLAEYPDSADCTIPTSPTATPITYVEPTPTIGCNDLCSSNKDCTNNEHICYEGNCRLAEYPASTSCTIPATPGTDQPKMPEELPKSGSEDIINWIKAGIGILGAGALLLLL